MKKINLYIQEKLVITKDTKEKDTKNIFAKSIDEFVEKYQLKDISTTHNIRFGKYRYEFAVDNNIVSEAIQSNIYDRWDSGSWNKQERFTTEIIQFAKKTFNWSSDISIDIFISDKDAYNYTSHLCIFETNKNADLIKMQYRHDYNKLDIFVKDDDMKDEFESWMVQILEYIINKED